MHVVLLYQPDDLQLVLLGHLRLLLDALCRPVVLAGSLGFRSRFADPR